MTPDLHTRETNERQSAVGQEMPPSDLPRTAPLIPSTDRKDTIEAQQVTPPPTTPPPAPPRGPTAERLRQTPSAGRWAWAIALAILGGLSWFVFGWGLVAAGSNIFFGILVGAVPALTCLAAGWLLRSWWGLAATVIVYLAVSALLWVFAIVGAGDVQAWLVAFPLYAVLPAVVMSAIGTAIGMARAR